MNHGYCKNCWWWKCLPDESGLCYMQNDDKGHNYKKTKETDYCPDYINRSKEEKKSGTLENWIKS